MKTLLLFVIILLSTYWGYSQTITTAPAPKRTLTEIHANSRVDKPHRSGNFHPMMNRHLNHRLHNRAGGRHRHPVRHQRMRRRMLK